MNQPVRSYPLRTVNEPSVYVTGEKAGVKVYPPGGPQMHTGPGGPPSMQQAMISQQNNAMESLERRRERERERERVRDRTSSTAGVSAFFISIVNKLLIPL